MNSESHYLKTFTLFVGTILLSIVPPRAQAQQYEIQPWITNGLASQAFVISGTGGRNNPVRTKLRKPFSGEEIFVRYRIRYAASSIDPPTEGNGEFFVLWLDETEGAVGSSHATNVPNIGIHVSDNENRFMIRYSSSNQKFSALLVGSRDFLVVARMWKSIPGNDKPFDKLDLWVDPKTGAENSPDTSASNTKSIAQINWMGFSTGVKTELDDKITVWDIALAETWSEILEIPSVSTPESHSQRPAVNTVTFKEHIFPILKSRCFSCHAGESAKEGIRLDLVDEVMNQTQPRDAKSSRLYQLVTDNEMPPEGPPLSDDEQRVLAAWIDEGLDWDEQLLPTPSPKTNHWAFQPIRRPDIPKVANLSWTRTPVDSFIAARHAEAELNPNPPAGPQTLRRRMYLDMHGLPPKFIGTSTDEESDVPSVDELLADPAYGQRWGRHWLDLARWAESNGHQHNRNRPHAWRYRDWVIDAFNQNMPYAEFLTAQIAGDLESSSADQMVATGFLSAARYSGNELDKRIQRNDILVDVANTTASVTLGLTLGCAQCHTHKFDPISIRDYYRFQAFFADGQPHNVALAPNDSDHNDSVKSLASRRWQLFDRVYDRLVRVKRKQGHSEPILVTPTAVVGGMNAEEKKQYQSLTKQLQKAPQTWAFVSQFGNPTAIVLPHEMRWPLPRQSKNSPADNAAILIRGEIDSAGPIVRPGLPSVFSQDSTSESPTRKDLAHWLMDKNNPLTARVWVNRIWQWHFGRGLVESSSDFGTQGTPPSHPKLLGFLASELIDRNWDTNHIHRLILESATYRQSGKPNDSNLSIDPENQFYWRWTPRRLESEAIRDSMLAVSESLDRRPGGPSDEKSSKRRSVYLRQKRDSLPRQQLLFDGASGNLSCARRRVSTNPLQPLWMLNSSFAQDCAEKLAEESMSIRKAFHATLGRAPNDGELSQLSALENEYGLVSVCLVLLNSSEFVYIP